MILSDDHLHEREHRVIQGNLESLDCHDLYSLSFLVSILSSMRSSFLNSATENW